MLFIAIAYVMVVGIGWRLVDGSWPSPFSYLLYFGAFYAISAGVFAIPGLVAHRMLIRGLERRGQSVDRTAIVIRALVIVVASPWWLQWIGSGEIDRRSLLTGLLWTATAAIYGAIVPQRPPRMPTEMAPGKLP